MYRMKKAYAVVVAAAIAAMFGGVAIAQAPAPGQSPAPSPQDTAKAWELQAKAVAEDLKLSAADTAKLVAAYKAARESHAAALDEKQGGGRQNFDAVREVNKSEKAKLEKALQEFLKPEQAAAALATLGTFNRRWDTMVLALDGMGLDAKVRKQAMKLVTDYVAEQRKAMEEAASNQNWESVRDKSRELREKLDAELAKILDLKQMMKWKEETAQRRGRRMPGMSPVAAPTPAQK